MYILGLVLLILGLTLFGFGYFIFFKKKYDLINNFKEDLKLNRFGENYAKRIGLIELIWGIIFIGLFLLTRMIPDGSIFFLLIGVLGLIISLGINYIKFNRN
ncbi:MAG TPA: DUF3784 domain-containing protein [Clostridia bacterium]|nr:DUF3784 domain-containing protein [Clostridia bacterium]